MGKKLAIRGHSTRGKEVIELFEMMGGKNTEGYIGVDYDEIYTIEDGYIIQSYDWNDCLVFTLEEFLKKYPFKIGDKVAVGHGNTLTIKSMSWSTDCETMVYDFKDSVIVLAAEDLLKYNAEFLINKEKSEEVGKMLCDTTLNHLHRISLKNVLSELYEHIKTTSKEELEREFKEIESEGWTNVGPTVEEFITFYGCVNSKPKYPDDYEECVRIAKNIHGYDINIDAPAYRELLESFVKLLICRDAYWKIAGEQMGLDKPWEPDLENEELYCIQNYNKQITISRTNTPFNKILIFPTGEMRDAFYDNFKDLIEQCKELL